MFQDEILISAMKCLYRTSAGISASHYEWLKPKEKLTLSFRFRIAEKLVVQAVEVILACCVSSGEFRVRSYVEGAEKNRL